MSLSLHLNLTVSLSPAWNHSLNLCFQLSLPLTRSSTVTPITGRGRRRRRGRGRQRRLHHTQKEMSYYEGNHFLLISQHNAHHLFYFISPDSFHGSSFYTISRCTSIIVLDNLCTHYSMCTIPSFPFPNPFALTTLVKRRATKVTISCYLFRKKGPISFPFIALRPRR